MNIKILDSWLRDFLDTPAKPSEIAKCLSLSGPSVEKTLKDRFDYTYNIEVTTNRIDCASVYGIAREASAILPRFGIPAKLKPIRSESKEYSFTKEVPYLTAAIDLKLCPRFTAILIKNVKITESPDRVKKRLKASGIRPINNVVDISNYIMLELGQPVHTFDYDEIKEAKMVLRESKKGEVIKTLDGKEFILHGGDIVIEDGQGRLVDLAGIMGGSLSAVNENTKNVLLFVQTYDPAKIRKTSMALAQRTMAATIFEKGTDPEQVGPAILRATEMFKSLTKGLASKDILNIYPHPYKTTSVDVSIKYITERLGVEISKKEIINYLSPLMFDCHWAGDTLQVMVPSFRSKDVVGPEDILEEIARIYGYHNLPNQIMTGTIPVRPTNPKFDFELYVKNIISGFGGNEIYTLSLVPLTFTDEKHLKLKNPLGPETEYLRTSLMPSILQAAKDNFEINEKFHLFEIANVYLPKSNDLPEERQMLGGIFFGYDYRDAKGTVEAILERLNIEPFFKTEESKGFSASSCAYIYHKDKMIGKIGVVENFDFVYYELIFQKIFDISQKITAFKPIPKYPAQIEDLTLVLPEKTRVGDVISSMRSVSGLIEDIELKDIYKNSYTFRIWYQDSKKTLTNEDVNKVRKEMVSYLKSKFGILLKD